MQQINDVYVFIAPNFGVKQALCQALYDACCKSLATKTMPAITYFEVVDKAVGIFNVCYDAGTVGNKVHKELVGKVLLHSQLSKTNEMVENYIDIEFEEVK